MEKNKEKESGKFYGVGAKDSAMLASRPFTNAKRRIECTEKLCELLRHGDSERAKELLSDAILDTVDTRGVTPLMYAVKLNNVSLVRAMLAAGATLDYQEKTFGSTALMCAAQLQNREMFSTLVMLGANPGIRNNRNRTARDILRSPEKGDTPFWEGKCECVANGF